MSDVTQRRERNKQIVNRILFDGFVGGDLSLWDELVSPDFVDKTAAPGTPNDRAAWVAQVKMFRDAFPGCQLEVLHQVAEGDLVEVTDPLHRVLRGHRLSRDLHPFLLGQFTSHRLNSQPSRPDIRGS